MSRKENKIFPTKFIWEYSSYNILFRRAVEAESSGVEPTAAAATAATTPALAKRGHFGVLEPLRAELPLLLTPFVTGTSRTFSTFGIHNQRTVGNSSSGR